MKDSSAVADSTNKAQISSSDSSLKASKNLKDDASKFLVKSYEAGIYEIQLS